MGLQWFQWVQWEPVARARARATVGEARGGKREVGCLKVSAHSKSDTLHPAPKFNWILVTASLVLALVETI